MRCVEAKKAEIVARRAVWIAVLGALAGCAGTPADAGRQGDAASGKAGSGGGPTQDTSRDMGKTAGGRAAAAKGELGGDTGSGPVKLGAPATPKSWEDARRQAARRIVAANPHVTYASKPPDMLLAIPVLRIELHADGSIRKIEVMRKPSQAQDTVDIAIQAVRKAAPFGDVSKLPKPWQFNETFLFNNQRKFKPMTLDQN